ncbi:uncharacterized protein LOC141720187 [Apium graveolens]|uniref:uncharacterized protein LOC141720187 n=1 Tax=Apium graveolens TaxID=4045 RepID=UPI003D7B5B22
MRKPHQRETLWADLVRLSSLITLPWVVSGDFNCILHTDEVLGGREQWSPDMTAFKDCVSKSGLDNIPTLGSLFTWWNNKPNYLIQKRLDRMLSNQHWLHSFPEGFVEVKNIGIMDHCLLLLTVPLNVEINAKPFQYFNFLSKIQGFRDTVAAAWSYSPNGDPMNILNDKLKRVKKGLIALNKKQGNAHSNVSRARDVLKRIQDKMRMGPINNSMIIEERAATNKLEALLIIEESFLLQKSRVRWLAEGDVNNSFFFNQVKSNWNKNKILAIENSDGITVFDQQQVATVALDFFSNSIGTRNFHNPCIFDFPCPTLSDTQASLLEQPVTLELVHATMKSMKLNKAPGPDGFPVDLFLEVWDIVGRDFCAAILCFFLTSIMNKGNHSIIDKSQSAFIKGHSISNNVLVSQELFRGYGRASGIPKCALKLDLYKAFDSIDWSFLMQALSRMRFTAIFLN